MKRSVEEHQPKRRPGRPVSFDREEALEKAMTLFWSSGYETTSVAELTKAMGITAPSLYMAFGDKESLFLECVRRYVGPDSTSAPKEIRESTSARTAAEDLLKASASWFTQRGKPLGCLVASAASTGSQSSAKVRAALTAVRREIYLALVERIERDITSGALPTNAQPKALSAMIVATIQGMSTMARDGFSKKQLLDVAAVSMTAWPVGGSGFVAAKN